MSSPPGIFTWALDVADDAAGSVVHELDADLGDTSSRACKIPSECLLFLLLFAHFLIFHTGATENSGDLDELDWDPAHCCQLLPTEYLLFPGTDFAESIFAYSRVWWGCREGGRASVGAVVDKTAAMWCLESAAREVPHRDRNLCQAGGERFRRSGRAARPAAR